MKIMYVNALKYLLLILYVSRIDVANSPFESNRSDVRMKCNIVRTLLKKSIHISLSSVFS